ncbi:FMN-dependent alpha-hydroxy acid dehydrogenase [Aspergillus campestris IBT 28561]|uniref:FMN-dependent alpha-hydroxy acid dehydrogenase n=1 Tax=Aspergillus campestris (strain IBT 28561) TaxID=1392248 RepID=A0A2I1CXC9_ASPC2|nr:FMN-dependent alpha-hydroxy acid dehydrogenase [Aspergillus campestris IBT 28561]PKY02285.1 FMN-dependent alpha-hydroxy acid dehydrogenase [Aspergillus campestris IBT 28561]
MPERYGDYQTEIYGQGAIAGLRPNVTTDPRLLEEQAKKALGVRGYNYIAGGAGEKATMDSNRLAFRQWKLIPRMLRPMDKQDLTVNLFGQDYPSPVLMAPVGVQSIFHEDKETGLAEACSEVGIPYTLSTASTSSIEEVAQSNGDGKRWYQLYWPQSDDITLSLLKRAKENGYSVLVVTLDTWSLAWRPADLDNAYVPFSTGVGCQNGFSDPVFRAKFEKETGTKVEDDILAASRAWISDAFPGQPPTWERIAFLRKNWDGPLVLKGIQHVDDARFALKAGCDGIVVSNHGGRQVDGAIGSLEVLPEIVDAVGDKMTVLFDSGVRTGADVIKALCLGAKAVLVGRPFIYGLAINGKHGAKAVMQGMLADLWQNMSLAGISGVAECTRDRLRKVPYGGDAKAML